MQEKPQIFYEWTNYLKLYDNNVKCIYYTNSIWILSDNISCSKFMWQSYVDRVNNYYKELKYKIFSTFLIYNNNNNNSGKTHPVHKQLDEYRLIQIEKYIHYCFHLLRYYSDSPYITTLSSSDVDLFIIGSDISTFSLLGLRVKCCTKLSYILSIVTMAPTIICGTYLTHVLNVVTTFYNMQQIKTCL